MWLKLERFLWQGGGDGMDNSAFMMHDELDDEMVEYKDEGYIELVLKLLAQMCDGQFKDLQVGKCSLGLSGSL